MDSRGSRDPLYITLNVDNAAGESFCKSTAGLSKLRGVYQMSKSRIKELRDAKVVTASHVDTSVKQEFGRQANQGLITCG